MPNELFTHFKFPPSPLCLAEHRDLCSAHRSLKGSSGPQAAKKQQKKTLFSFWEQLIKHFSFATHPPNRHWAFHPSEAFPERFNVIRHCWICCCSHCSFALVTHLWCELLGGVVRMFLICVFSLRLVDLCPVLLSHDDVRLLHTVEQNRIMQLIDPKLVWQH